VMDSSGTIKKYFDQMKAFVSDLIGKFLDVNGGVARVGAVTYNKEVGTTINLDEHSSVTSLQTAINNLRFMGGYTYTDRPLQYVRENITGNAGDRTNVPNVVVVLTDGCAHSDRWGRTQVRVNYCIRGSQNVARTFSSVYQNRAYSN